MLLIINLLLPNHFYPAMSYRRVHKESDKLLYTIWSLVIVRNHLKAHSSCNFLYKVNEMNRFFVKCRLLNGASFLNLFLKNSIESLILYLYDEIKKYCGHW